MILVSFPCFAMTMVTTYAQFVTCRTAIGFSLASFVSTQYWTTQMFTPKIVGGANAITAGWGNLGGGVTHVLTVIMFEYFTHYGPYFRAWRQCYFAPGLLHLLIGSLCVPLCARCAGSRALTHPLRQHPHLRPGRAQRQPG